MPPQQHWKSEPEAHDYPAAQDYLSLLMSEREVRLTITALKRAPILQRKAKDLLRASGLELLPATNFHVAADINKVKRGKPLSPVLLVRGHGRSGAPLIVADGYHRICAGYRLDEDADVPCKLVERPAP